MVITNGRKNFTTIGVLIGVLLLSSFAQAQQTAAPVVDQRIANQYKLIDRAVGLGHFNRHEERILLDNLEFIKHLEARFQASGSGFTVAEREQLHGLLNQNSLMIERNRPVETLRPARVYYDGPYRIGGGTYYYYNGGFYHYDGGEFRFHHDVPSAEREKYEEYYNKDREHYNRDYQGWREKHPEHPWTSQKEEDRLKAPAIAATTLSPAKPASETKPASVPAAKLPSGKKININAASKEELSALPGVGPAKAQAIIDGRPYKKTEDIMKIKGMKQGEFNKIKDLIAVE